MDNDEDTELKQLWEEAVDEYSNKSKRGPIMEEWKMLVNTDIDLDKLIEQHESDFSRFRNRREKFWGVFKAAMTQLQRLGNIAQAGIGLTPFAPASIIIEAGLFLINAGSDVADAYDSLEDLFKRIRDITDRLDEYLKGDVDHKLRKVAIKLLCSLLDVFCEANATIRRGRGREMMRRVVGKENKIQRALDQLDEMVRTEITLITAKTYAITQRIDDKAETDRSRELLRQALYTDAAGDNDVFHVGIESSRIELTGNWLLKEKLFDKWVRMEFPVLWIMGKPGTGKTYLASRVISHLRQNPIPNVASYFYIREGMNTQHTPGVILKTIANQVIELHDPYRKWAIAACRDDKSLLSPNSIWDSLFVKPFKDVAVTSRPLFIVIDGVDEATRENQELLVKLAKSLSDSRPYRCKLPAIQLLLLGRPDLDYNVSNAWRGERRRPKIIHVQPSLSKVDIERFIKKGVQEGIPLLKRMKPTPSKRLRKNITTTLSDSSDGMFMLAKLMLAEIKDMNKPELIREALAKPPFGLDDMFKRVITRLTVMGGFDKEDLNEMIMWVSCAKRDLLLGELDLILKLRDLRQNGIVGLDDELRTRFGSFFSVSHTEDDAIDEEDDMSPISSDVKGQSRPPASGQSTELQVKVDTDSDHWTDIDGEDDSYDDEDEDEADGEDEDVIPDKFFVATVKFGHASVGQHFRTAPFHEGIGININFARAHIATTCLQFLTGNIPKRNQRPWRKPDLFRYSADYFLDHLAEIQPETLESLRPIEFKRLSDEILVLLKDQSSLCRWFQSVSDEHKFMCQLFSQSTCSRLLECITKPTDEVNASPDAQWLRRAKASSESLLEPFAKSIAEAWLLSDSCDGILAILFLRLYTSTRSDFVAQWTLPPNRPFEYVAESISPEEIRQLASFGGLKITRDWHLALGRALRRINTRQHLLAAVEEFQHAIQKSNDPDSRWIGRVEEVNGLVALEEYEQAIVAASNALESVPAHRVSSKIGLLELMQYVNLQLGNNEAAFAAALKAWETAPYSHHAAFNMIYTSHETGRFSRTAETVRSILARGSGEFLSEIMTTRGYASEFISNACAEAGQLDLARDAFMAVSSQAAESGNSLGHAMAEAALAELYYQYYQYDEEPIKMWEKIVEAHPRTMAAVNASFALAPLYFMNAADSETGDADSWISKLKQLVGRWGPRGDPGAEEEEMAAGVSASLGALVGRWYSQRGEVDLARANILPLVKLAILSLTDKIDSNDRWAYMGLGWALGCFGDRANAEIAYAFAMPLAFVMPLWKSKELLDFEASVNDSKSVETKSSKHQGDTGPIDPLIFLFTCSGRCHRRRVDYRSLSLCEVCYNVGFCDECLQKLMDGNLPFRICNPKHSFLQMYPPRGLVTKEAQGYMVRVNEKLVVNANDWLGMISRDWLGG
ncbi:hypothetical protein F5B21DRAFT_482373 [Xylaria acuta]|nr:hypothetical protein F5B21DRAFT_482373 [Xylaria acuta]